MLFLGWQVSAEGVLKQATVAVVLREVAKVTKHLIDELLGLVVLFLANPDLLAIYLLSSSFFQFREDIILVVSRF